MSLSSLAESSTSNHFYLEFGTEFIVVIALPAGMRADEEINCDPPQDILDALEQADELFVSDLTKLAERDSVVNVRGAAIAAALISTYRASLLQTAEYSPALVSHLLGKRLYCLVVCTFLK